MKKEFFKTLRFRLSLIIMLFAIIPMLIANAFILTQSRSMSLRDQKAESAGQLSLLNTNVDAIFEDMLANVDYFADGSLLQSIDSSITSYVNTTSETTMTPARSAEAAKDTAQWTRFHPWFKQPQLQQKKVPPLLKNCQPRQHL